MARTNVDRVRALVKFVIVWLIAVYIFEVVKQANWYVGVGGVAVAALVNVYARRSRVGRVLPAVD